MSKEEILEDDSMADAALRGIEKTQEDDNMADDPLDALSGIEEIQSDRAVDLLSRNKQQAEEIATLKSRIEGLKVNRDYLFKENERFQQTSLRHNRLMDETKEQIAVIKKEIDKLRTNHSNALEQIWNKLLLVKIHFC